MAEEETYERAGSGEEPERGAGGEEAGSRRPPERVRGPRDDGLERIQINKNRPLQAARTGGRKLFDAAAQDEFLEWFAATCNLAWSAEQAGFNYKTVLRHRMNDARFREGWNRAVEQAVARLEAKRLETRRKEAPIGIEGDRDAPEMDDIAPERMDAILREYNRGFAGIKKPGRRPRVASNAEVRAALEKALVAFAQRMKAKQGGAGNDPAVIASEAKQSSDHSDTTGLDRRGADAPRDDEKGFEE